MRRPEHLRGEQRFGIGAWFPGGQPEQRLEPPQSVGSMGARVAGGAGKAFRRASTMRRRALHRRAAGSHHRQNEASQEREREAGGGVVVVFHHFSLRGSRGASTSGTRS